MKTLQLLDCDGCKAPSYHRKLMVVKFLTKCRELVVATYQCVKCGGIKNVTHEKENKDYQVWD